MKGYSGLKIDEYRSRDVMIIIGLIEEDVLAILYSMVVGCVLFKYSIGTDSMFSAKLFPELCADFIR